MLKAKNLQNFDLLGALEIRGYEKLRFLLQKAHPCVKTRRLSHFAWMSVDGSDPQSREGKKSQKVSDSHRNDVSPLTQGLRYRAACDELCLSVCPCSWWRASRPTACRSSCHSVLSLVMRSRWLKGEQLTSNLMNCPTTWVNVDKSCGFVASHGYNTRSTFVNYIHFRLISTYDTPHSGTMIRIKSCWEMFRCNWQSVDIIK